MVRKARKHGKTLTKGISNTRSGKMPIGIRRLIQAQRLDKTAGDMSFRAFASILTKHAAEKEVTADSFKVTRREAERAARTLAAGPSAKKTLGHMGTFATVGPGMRVLAKGVAAGATSPGRRMSASLRAMGSALKDSKSRIEDVVAGAGTGAVLSTLQEARGKREARDKVQRYISEARPVTPIKNKLKAVLD